MNNLTIGEFKNIFENYLQEYLSSLQEFYPLTDSFKYSILNGGKRIRPYLVYLGAFAVANKNCDNVINYIKELSIGIELIHSYSLVHDDLPCMDNDTLRRGKPTTHVKYGAGMATLTGDAMLNAASEIMLSAIDNEESMKCSYVKDNVLAQVNATRYILNNSGINGMVGGQCIDLKEDKSSYSLQDYIKMNLLKTSALIKGALIAGAKRFEASSFVIKNLEIYADNLGLIFQIVDDILDVTSTEAVLGKSIHSDKDHNKITYIDYVGLEQSKIDCIKYASKAKDAIKQIEKNISNSEVFYKLIDDMLNRKY